MLLSRCLHAPGLFSGSLCPSWAGFKGYAVSNQTTVAINVSLFPSLVPVKGLLGIQDLGQIFFEPIKDKQGNILVVTLKEVKTNQTFESVRWVPLSKLQTSRKSVSSPEEPTALDTLLMTMQVAGSHFSVRKDRHGVLTLGSFLLRRISGCVVQKDLRFPFLLNGISGRERLERSMVMPIPRQSQCHLHCYA